MMINNQCFSFRHKGFTLVELIIVIILISILSISVFSRFSGTSGFAEYTYQARLISALRAMQTRAMHASRNDYCYKIILNQSQPAFGPPLLDYDSGIGGPTDPTCANTINFSTPEYLRTSATEMASEDVRLSTVPSFAFIDFDSMGRPVDGNKNFTCANTCKITLTGESAVSVCVESQGYIHACD